MKVTITIESHKLWLRGFPRSRGKLLSTTTVFMTNLTWKSGDLPWKIPIVVVTWTFNHVVLFDYVTNWKLYIFYNFTTISIATKLDKVVTYHEELPPTKLIDPSIMWFFERSCNILNTLYLHLH